MKDLELHVPETTTQSSVIPVNWCLSPKLLQRLKDVSEVYDGKIPYILLVTTPEENWKVRRNFKLEIRKAVPVYDLLTYVDFKRPGENAIVGIITFSPEKYLKREDFVYGSDILDDPIYLTKEEREKATEPVICSYINAIKIFNNIGEGKLVYDLIKVNVPSEVFAKPPPQWEQDWVNLWFSFKPHDQCNYRRRRIVAYTVQPIVLLIFALFKFIFACFWLSFGQKIGKLKNIINPVRYFPFTNMFKTERWLVIPGIKNQIKHLANIANPLFWIFNFYMVYSVGISWWSIPSIFGLVFAAVGICIGIIYGFDLIKKRLSKQNRKRIFKNKSNSSDKITKPKYKAIKKLEKAESGLICNGQTYFKPKDLPKQSRTIKIMYEGVKASVCRPFSQ